MELDTERLGIAASIASSTNIGSSIHTGASLVGPLNVHASRRATDQQRLIPGSAAFADLCPMHQRHQPNRRQAPGLVVWGPERTGSFESSTSPESYSNRSGSSGRKVADLPGTNRPGGLGFGDPHHHVWERRTQAERPRDRASPSRTEACAANGLRADRSTTTAGPDGTSCGDLWQPCSIARWIALSRGRPVRAIAASAREMGASGDAWTPAPAGTGRERRSTGSPRNRCDRPVGYRTRRAGLRHGQGPPGRLRPAAPYHER
jgi:hypothetical protein